MSQGWQRGHERQRSYESRGGHVLGFVLELLFAAVGIGIVFAALRNVFSDGFEVERMAMAKACEPHGPACRAQMTRWERSPIGQTFDMYTPRGTVIVRCQREYSLVGDYGCTRLEMPSSEPAMPVVSAGPSAAKPARSVEELKVEGRK